MSVLLFLTISSEALAAGYSVGVSPGLLDAGEIERGAAKIVRFHIVTPSEIRMIVEVETSNGGKEVFDRPDYMGFLSNYSEERSGGWVEFLRNPVELIPANESLKTEGGELKAWSEVKFILKVPEDAESGYHTLMLKPMPIIPQEQLGGVGMSVVTVIALPTIFKVPGKAVRDGEILDITAGNYISGGREVEVNIFFHNTGTVTMSSTVNSVKIYDMQDRLLDTLDVKRSHPKTVMPGETTTLTAYWNITGLQLGDYRVFANVTYGSGYASKDSIITLKEPQVIVKEGEIKMPQWLWLLAIVIIILISYLIYKKS